MLEEAARYHLECEAAGGTEILEAEVVAGQAMYQKYFLPNMWEANLERLRRPIPTSSPGSTDGDRSARRPGRDRHRRRSGAGRGRGGAVRGRGGPRRAHRRRRRGRRGAGRPARCRGARSSRSTCATRSGGRRSWPRPPTPSGRRRSSSTTPGSCRWVASRTRPSTRCATSLDVNLIGALLGIRAVVAVDAAPPAAGRSSTSRRSPGMQGARGMSAYSMSSSASGG